MLKNLSFVNNKYTLQMVGPCRDDESLFRLQRNLKIISLATLCTKKKPEIGGVCVDKLDEVTNYYTLVTFRLTKFAISFRNLTKVS